uniref:Uncharacterized protein n=1 Tax=Rhizophora mucronata TaxID=61149 RepID=A0A2P2LRR0_RHIMU
MIYISMAANSVHMYNYLGLHWVAYIDQENSLINTPKWYSGSKKI